MKRKIMKGLRIALALAAVCRSGPSAAATWVDAWSRTTYSTTITRATTVVTTTVPPQFANQTIRLTVWTTIGGTQARVKLTNAFSTVPLSIGEAHVALRQSADAIIRGTDYPLTFGGLPTVTIPAGGETLSDPVPLTVPAHADLSVSLYFPGTFTPQAFHEIAQKTSYVSRAGDYTAWGATPGVGAAAPTTTTTDFFLTEVQVLSSSAPAEVVAVGDSITDGVCSDVDANGDWPDLLSKRLTALPDGTPVGVINAGINSNRFEASDGAGIRGLNRLPELLARPGVRWVVILEGINDMSYENATASALIAAYQSAIAQAHAAGVKAFGVPILPIKHGSKDTPADVATRTTVNDWIRTSGAYDAVIDFEPVLADPADPGSMLAALTCDHTHPNQAGYNAMVNSIDLTLFQ